MIHTRRIHRAVICVLTLIVSAPVAPAEDIKLVSGPDFRLANNGKDIEMSFRTNRPELLFVSIAPVDKLLARSRPFDERFSLLLGLEPTDEKQCLYRWHCSIAIPQNSRWDVRVEGMSKLLFKTSYPPACIPKERLIEVVAGPMFTMREDGLNVWVQTREPAQLSCHVELLTPEIAAAFPSFTEPKPAPSLPSWTGSFQTSGPRSIGLTRVPAEALPFDAGGWARVYIKPGGAGDNELSFVSVMGEFTLPPKRKAGQYVIGFGSCSHQRRFPDQPIWEVAARERPDCFLFIGDNIYLPSKPQKFPETAHAVRELYQNTYAAVRRLPELQPLLRSTMSYAIWDDHDFGPNNSNRTWKWADLAWESLNQYFPNRYGLPDARGCFYKFAWGDIDVFMLDDRSFRDPNRDPGRKTMFGAKQLAWLKAGLEASRATFKLVVCGNQMLSDCPTGETWGNLFPAERDAFLEWLWARRIVGVVFLAGDRHFAELVRKRDPRGHGPDLWELTSSPLANFHFVGAELLANPEREAIYASGVNVGMLGFDTAASPPRVEMLILDEEGDVVIRHVLTTGSARNLARP